MPKEYTMTEHRIIVKAWNAGLCRRCISKLLAAEGFARSPEAVSDYAHRNRTECPARKINPALAAYSGART